MRPDFRMMSDLRYLMLLRLKCTIHFFLNKTSIISSFFLVNYETGAEICSVAQGQLSTFKRENALDTCCVARLTFSFGTGSLSHH